MSLAAKTLQFGQADGTRPRLIMACALPWAGIPHRQHELACGLAEGFDTIYLEPPTQAKGAAGAELDDTPTPGPEFGAGGTSARPRVARLTTPIPRWLWYLSSQADILRFRRAGQALAPHLPSTPGPRILWVDGGSSAPAVMSMPYDILVYDCVDLDWAYSSVALRRSALKRWHSILLQRADIILFSMRALFEEVKEKRPGCYFVPNACSSAHFNGSAPCPPVLQPIPNPRIGFIGAMLGQRFDAALIRAAAKARPQWSFVLVGDADEPTRAALRGITNIYFLGRFPHADMPAFAVHFDVCLIPNLLQTELSYCFPKKLYEYLATGRPVVSTPIPEVTPLAPLVKISRTPGEFVQKIEQCLTENLDPARAAKLGAERQAIASENTWERRVAQIVGILDSELRSRGYSGLEGTARVTP